MRALCVLEESGLPYVRKRVNLQAGEQKTPAYLAINPAGRIPAIVDHDGPGGKPLALAQSGAVSVYVAEKSGRLLPTDPVRRLQALQWMMSACTDAAAAGAGMFMLSAHPDAAEIHRTTLKKLFAFWDSQLSEREWIAGEFSLADLAFFSVYNGRRSAVDPNREFTHLARWGSAIKARPAIARALQFVA